MAGGWPGVGRGLARGREPGKHSHYAREHGVPRRAKAQGIRDENPFGR